MATNLSIDPKLIERALELSGERTKKAAVTRALEELAGDHIAAAELPTRADEMECRWEPSTR